MEKRKASHPPKTPCNQPAIAILTHTQTQPGLGGFDGGESGGSSPPAVVGYQDSATITIMCTSITVTLTSIIVIITFSFRVVSARLFNCKPGMLLFVHAPRCCTAGVWQRSVTDGVRTSFDTAYRFERHRKTSCIVLICVLAPLLANRCTSRRWTQRPTSRRFNNAATTFAVITSCRE